MRLVRKKLTACTLPVVGLFFNDVSWRPCERKICGLYFATRHDGHASSIDARFLANRSSFVVPPTWKSLLLSQDYKPIHKIYDLDAVSNQRGCNSSPGRPHSSFCRDSVWWSEKTSSYNDFSHRRQEAWRSCCPNSRRFLSHHHLFRRSLHSDLPLF